MVLLRYILVAGIAYGIDLGGFILLIHIGYAPLISNILVKIAAAIFGFLHIVTLPTRFLTKKISLPMRSAILVWHYFILHYHH